VTALRRLRLEISRADVRTPEGRDRGGRLLLKAREIDTFEEMVQAGILGVSLDEDHNATVELLKRYPFREDRETFNRAMRRRHAKELKQWRQRK
jgi:hypothetical protein